MSSSANGPVFKPHNQEFFVFTNMNAHPNFKNLSNNTLQLTGEVWDGLRMAHPDETQEMLDAKGKVVLAYEGTTDAAPGTVKFDAGIVEKVGYKSPEGTFAIFIVNSDPKFYKGDDYDGTSNVTNTAASTPTKVDLIGGGWKKSAIQGSEFQFTADEFNKGTGVEGVNFDLYKAVTGEGIAVSVIIDRSITVELDAPKLTADRVNSNDPYDVLRPIYDFRGEDIEVNEVDSSGKYTADPNATDGAYAQGKDSDDEMTGGAYSDGLSGGKGADILDGGVGADRLEGGEGNDIIKGGDDGPKTMKNENGQDILDANGNTIPASVWEYGDRAVFKHKKSDYEITSADGVTFTVKHVKNKDGGDDGTDTLTGIEILEFDGDSMLLVVQTDSYSFKDEFTGLTVSEDFAHGTKFGDVITGGDGRSILHGEGGHDVIIGDTANGNSGDHLEGGAGNDFLDGAGRGTGVMPWENDNAASFMGAGRRFTIEKAVYSTSSYSRIDEDGKQITSLTDKAYLDSKKGAMNSSNFSFNANQVYFVVTDSLSDADGGLGTDILTNIDELFFDDKSVRLSVFKDPWGGFIEGTDFGDTIVGEGVDEFIESGKGNDIVSGGDGADRAILGRGDDIFDGGGDIKNFDANQFMADNFGGGAAGNFDPTAFMNMMDMGGAAAGTDMGMGGMDAGMGGMNTGMDGMNTGMDVGTGTANTGGDNYNTGGDHHSHGMDSGPSGDTAEYRGDYSRYKVTTYKTDANGANSDLATKMGSKFGGYTLKADTSYTIVEDGNTGKKGTGTDLLVNVERVQFNDFTFNLDVVQNINYGFGGMAGEVNWSGTFGDDDINFNNVKITDSSKSASDTPDRDFMSGEAGNDVMVAGKGGDRLIGGTGNDIMDGGANGASANSWDEWLINDVAEYKASIENFEIKKYTFVKKALVITDTKGKTVYTVTPKTKGTETFGEVRRDGETKIAFMMNEGETFFVVSDKRAEKLGGEGTDILLGMEQAQFGYDWDGIVDFQVKYNVNQYGGSSGQGDVNAQGTQFADTINLVAGKAKNDTGGFGGFDDYNTGASIFDDNFFTNADTMANEMTSGFDIINWKPGPDETPVKTVTEITPFYTGESAIKGEFAIYQVNDGTSNRLIAFDTVANFVFDEVSSSDGNNTFKLGGAAYANASADKKEVNVNEWMPVQGVDTPVATGVKITFPDGHVSEDTFEIYTLPTEFSSTGEKIAWNPTMMMVAEKVQDTGGTWYVVQDASQYENITTGGGTGGGTTGGFGFDLWSWAPGANDNGTEITALYLPAMNFGGQSMAEEKMDGKYMVYTVNDGAKDILIAVDQEYGGNFQVTLTGGKYYQYFETTDSGSNSNGSSSSHNNSSYNSYAGANETAAANRIHDSYINAGRGNDIILAGQGRDTIEGGRGDDFIDGGSESDFLATLSAATAGGSAIKNQRIENPDTGKKSLYSIYDGGTVNGQQVLWAWDDNQTDPTYFKVSGNTTNGYKPIEVTVDANFYDERFSQYDEAIYSGSKARYTITEVYIKMEAGQPDLDTNGDYQVKSLAQFGALTDSKEKAKWTKVVQVKDVLPDNAGGTGTDYLLNIEEVRFEDGKEQLEIDSFGWPEDRPFNANYSWSNGGKTKVVTGLNSYDNPASWGGGQQTPYQSGVWDVYEYGETLADGSKVYALWNTDWNGFEQALTIKSGSLANNNAVFEVAIQKVYAGSHRGTIKDDTIGHAKNPDKLQADEIFGKAGDDLVIAGAGVDRIKGGSGDDTIWGGTHEGADQGMFSGDTAFYAGSLGRYDVLQNVYAKASSANGALDRDASGNAILYRLDDNAIKLKGIKDGGKKALSDLTTSNDYYEAVVVVDSLSDGQGGDGTDVLIGVEGLMFGHSSSGDHEWLEQVSNHSHGGSAMAAGGSASTLTKLSVEATGDDESFDQVWVPGDPDAIVTSSGSISSFDGASVSGGTATFANASEILITRTNTSSESTFVIQGTGDHDFNPTSGPQTMNTTIKLGIGQATAQDWKLFNTVTSITKQGSGNDGTLTIGTNGRMVDTPLYLAKYEGTDFDDIIYWNDASEFKIFNHGMDSGKKFSLNKAVEISFDGGKGDDIIYGSSSSHSSTPKLNFDYVKYAGNKAEYDISYNSSAGTWTVKHKVADSMGGTGVDTLKDIDAAVFGSGEAAQWSLFIPEVKSKKEFNENSGQEEVTGYKIRGTEYNDTVNATTYDDSVDQAIFFSPNGSSGGHDFFTGRSAGKDGLELSGLFSRYDISFDDASDTWTITDLLPMNKGGDGVVKAKSIEKIQFGGPFSLNIGSAFVGQKGGDDTQKIKVVRDVQNESGFHKYSFGKFSKLAGDGALLTDVGADDDGIATAASKNSGQTFTILNSGNLFDSYSGKYVTVTSTGNEASGSGTTFTVAGTDVNGTSISEDINGVAANVAAIGSKEFKTITSVTVGGQNTVGNVKIGYMNEMFMPAGYETADHDGKMLANEQQLGSAAPLVLEGVVGGKITLDVAQKISITSKGNDSGMTWTIVGTSDGSSAQTESSITGGNNSTVTSTNSFKTITSITAVGAGTAGKVSVSTAELPITVSHLYGTAQTTDAADLIEAIDGGSSAGDGTITQTEIQAKRNADSSFFPNEESAMGKGYFIHEKSGSFDGTTGLFQEGGSNVKLSFDFYGQGKDDRFYGAENNDSFSGAPGDDVFWGRGEEKAEWWDTQNSGDKAEYDGYAARYTISSKLTDTDTNSDNVWDKTGITKADFNAWIAANTGHGLSANDAPKYYTVTDSLDKLSGGDGVDYLIDIEKIKFVDKTYNLEIQTIKNAWDVNTTIIGTSGRDVIDGSLTNDASSDKDFQINAGLGADVIVGGIEPTGEGWVWGDTAVYDAQSKYFDIDIKELAFSLSGGSVNGHGNIDWNADGSVNSDDQTFASALHQRFGGTRINQIKVKDNRPEDAGGLTGTTSTIDLNGDGDTDDANEVAGVVKADTMYGIEHIEFRSGEFGDMFDLSPTSYRDNNGKLVDFWGTNFGDVFYGDDGSTWINAQGGDDWIVAGDGADRIQPGSGADYINAGAHSNGPAGDAWFRDEVHFWEAPYGRTEVSKIKVQIDSDGDLLETSDNLFHIFNYTGSAAWAEDYEEDVSINETVTTFDSGTVTSGYSWVDAFLVTDTLPSSELGSIGINVLVGVEAIGFSDEFLDVNPTTDTWSYQDFQGNTIQESIKNGTPFDETISGAGGTDTLSGKGGHDKLVGGAGGDRLKGGKGNDILDGGANGNSGDVWRDMDMAEYTGIEAQYKVFKVAVDDSALTPNSTTIFDVGGKLEAQLGLTDVNSNGTADTVVLDGYTVVRSNGTQGSMNDTAYLVMDFLPAKMGGTGNDLLINVEQVQFQESFIDLGLRIVKDNWDGDNANGYEWVEVVGTDGADDITAWGSGTDLDGTTKTVTTSDDVTADNEIRGKGGDDVIFGYAGGDRIEGGKGNDFIDGGADGVTQNGWTPKDEAIYSGLSKNYIKTFDLTKTTDANSDGTADLTALMTKLGMSTSLLSAYSNTQKFHVIEDEDPAGTGTDILTNIEFLSFQDQFTPLTMEEFIDVDPVTGLETRRYVDGTSGDDTITGGVGNDDLYGNDGNDTITGGSGGDYITPGKGNDTIDGGADGTGWDGGKMFDVVIFNGDYADFEIEDTEIAGKDKDGNDIKILQITVSDPSPGGQGTDTLTNVETLQFNDTTVFVGITESQRFIWNGTEEVAGGSDIFGSIFGDTIQGTKSDDGIDGGKGADTIYGNDGPDFIKGGLGNDIIYGGKNGLDAWGNPGDDVAVFSGNQSLYTVTFYDSSGSSVSTYKADGYVKVKDSRTDATVSEGTDTLYGIEGIQFRDDYLGFKKVETFIDLDGDGKPDVGGKKGTSGSDLLEGSSMSEKIEGKVGDDILSGGGGDDTLIGGVGSDTMIGGNGGGNDTAAFEGNQANYTVTSVNKWVAHKADGTYEVDSSGNPKVYSYVHEDNAQAICNSVTITAAGDLTLNGTTVSSSGSGAKVATLNGGKFFTCEGSGNNTDTKFTITGKDASGASISEEVIGVNNGTAIGTKAFAEISKVTVAFTGGDTATDGAVKIGATSFADATTTASKGYSVATKDADADGTISDSEKSGSDVVDYVFEMENLQFADGFGRTETQILADDFDFDFAIDFAEVMGAIAADSFKEGASGMNSLLPSWVLEQEGGSGNEAAALKAIFEADNFFDGGAGRDDIHAGAGDDTIDPGAVSGDSGDVIDGGDGMDLLILAGKSTDWTTDADGNSSTDVGTGTYNGYDLTGFTKYTNKNGTNSDASDDIIVYAKNIEAIEYDDVFTSLQTTVRDIDQDGDGTVDSVMVKGAATAEAVTGSVIEGTDSDSLFAATKITNAANALTLATGDDDGFFANTVSGAGALTLSGSLVSGGVGDVGGKLVSINSNANDASVKFTVSGKDLQGNVQTEVVTGVSSGTVNTTKVFASVDKVESSAAASGTIKVGTADANKLGDGQYVTITSEGDDSAVDFTVTGIDANGNTQVEVISGHNVGEAIGSTLFKEITSIKASGTTAGKISVGSADNFAPKEDFIDGGAGDDYISSGDGGDTLIGGAGHDFMYGGANRGTDENGNPNQDVAKYNGRSTSVDLDGDGKISDAESADFSIKQSGFVVCNGIIDANGVCILTTLSGSTNAADADKVVDKAAKLSAAGDLAGVSSTTVDAAVILTSVGDDSGVTFTVTGTDADGYAITEKITGAKAGVATGSKVFKTVTKVSTDKATADKVSVGKAEVIVKSEDRIGDNEIDASTKPTIFTAAETAIAVKVANGYDANGDGQADTFEVEKSKDGVFAKAALAITADAITDNATQLGSQGTLIIGSGTNLNTNVVLTTTGDDSGVTFTINGTNALGETIQEKVTGVDTGSVTSEKVFATVTSIATDKGTAGTIDIGKSTLDIALTGSDAKNGVVNCAEAQNVQIKSHGNDSSITFTVKGTDAAGNAITETIKGANTGEAVGTKLFKTITDIDASGATHSNGIEVGLTSFYLDVDGDNKADTLTSGKIQKDLDGDGKFTGNGEYQISLAADMTVDEIIVATLDVDGDGNTAESGDIAGHQIFDGHKIEKVYEITDLNNKDGSGNNFKDIVLEVEKISFTDGVIKTGSETESKVTFSLETGITEEVKHEGSNFADEIIAGATTDVMEGGGGADNFVFGTGTGTDTIKDFVAKAVTNDSGTITTHADVIKVLKDVNGQSIDTASALANRVKATSTGTVVDLGGGNTILLEGVNSSDLTVANFAVVEVL